MGTCATMNVEAISSSEYWYLYCTLSCTESVLYEWPGGDRHFG
jgi:hypothetical protein